MFDRLRQFLQRTLKVPPEPEPPAGAPGSLRVFRAGRNFYHLKLAGWGLGQAGALAGIVFSLGFLARIEREAETFKAASRAEAAAAAARLAAAESTPESAPAASETSGQSTEKGGAPAARKKSRQNSRDGAKQALGRIVERSPTWLFPLLTFLEYGGVLLYLIQIPLTFAMVRLDYELRWYMVTDRSLRIRSGLLTVQESTMSFANLQQVMVTQGPLQRLLGLADVKVRSAGGGGEEHPATAGDSMHQGVLHGITNASEVRDLILDRLRRFRQAGLGDPDDTPGDDTTAAAASAPDSPLAAARDLLAEARALRQVL